MLENVLSIFSCLSIRGALRVKKTNMTITRARKSVALGLAMGLGFFSVSPLMAQTANPRVVNDFSAGNAAAECERAFGAGTYTHGYKLFEGQTNEWPGTGGTFTYSSANHTNNITISNVTQKTFDWSATNSIGGVIVKAGTGANVWEYNPQVKSDTGLYAYQNRDISHVTFCWNEDLVKGEEWCSPGYWRQEHHYDSWAATGYVKTTLYSAVISNPSIRLSRQGVSAGATTNPTLWQVLQNPQWYGGDSFNAVGDLLSNAHPDVNFNGSRVEDSCPLN
jgi:hypothetical protein